ncbi:MAG: hypothetical protein GX242_04045 [Clostridiales bacterium]|nr:hypothetical protein [Clostridiales bacterium]
MEKKNKLVEEVLKDFENRKEQRRNIERNWLLNINFLVGNQHSYILPNGEIATRTKDYYWQEREVYNHIAPIIETRLSKFASLKGSTSVRPASGDLNDINCAKFATRLLKSVEEHLDFSRLVDKATFWSELTGTAFYKITWADTKGRVIGYQDDKAIYEGDVEISVCSPYEIYPDSLSCGDLDECASIIHAKAYPVSVIENLWGVKLEGKEINVMNLDNVDAGGGFKYVSRATKLFTDTRRDHELVIERYSLPTHKYPNGRLVIVAGDKLLYEGDLPYINKEEERRGYPFIRQVCLSQPSSFYGNSIIDRLIPIQRAYNAIKNRKHEYLNRIAMGVLMVEDGSIDLDNIEEEGIAPGKVIVYRQGSNIPIMMNLGAVPSDFRDEEDRLLSGFITVSGVSDFLTSSSIRSENVSGVTLNLIIEQDNNRLSLTSDSIRNAIKEVGKHILRLYRQFATTKRLARVAGENGIVEKVAFTSSDITSDDLVFDLTNELSDTLASRKNTAMEIYRMGLLTDQNGKLSDSSRLKLLEMMGLGNWESVVNVEELHQKKAYKENENATSETPKIDDFDNHSIHIEEHTRYLISQESNLTDDARKKLSKHIREHLQYQRLLKEAKELTNA